ncbi:hypothetical protein Bca101_057975 [Brassica carinata]
MPLSKSPGPDGYFVEFLRSFWSVVGEDFMAAVQELFRNGWLLKHLNNTAIVLIPKTSQACKLGEFRPISCCNIAYKLIAKIIANRLKPILQECISPNQSPFLKGRSLGESVLLSSELIRDYEKSSCAKSSFLKAAAGRIKLHPKCEDPLVTHLLFADDLLLFSDGSRESLAGTSSVMMEFKALSGLEMNPSKSEIFFGGYNDFDVAELSGLSRFKQGIFPTRYLGLPLNPGRVTLSTLQPLLDKITSKMHSWTVKYLSFSGKIRLVASVIYGMVNFWSAVFVMLKTFYAKVDSLCAAFLWKNGTSFARRS